MKKSLITTIFALIAMPQLLLAATITSQQIYLDNQDSRQVKFDFAKNNHPGDSYEYVLYPDQDRTLSAQIGDIYHFGVIFFNGSYLANVVMEAGTCYRILWENPNQGTYGFDTTCPGARQTTPVRIGRLIPANLN